MTIINNTTQVPAWLNVEEIVPPRLRHDVDALAGSMRNLLGAVEDFICHAGDTRRRYERATSPIRYGAVADEVCDGLDAVVGFDVVRDIEALILTIIEAQIDPGNMTWDVEQIELRCGRLLSTGSPVLDFLYQARNELEVRAAESAAYHAERMAGMEQTTNA